MICKTCECHWYSSGASQPPTKCPECGSIDSRFDVSILIRVRWWFGRQYRRVLA